MMAATAMKGHAMDFRFDGKVALVTGAGSGLGRSHALALAARGAKVVVNDLGRSRVDPSRAAAQDVVDEITAAGGSAVADMNSVSEPESAKAMVETATTAFGRIDVVVNNAGFLRDRSFAKSELADFDAVVRVHLSGSAYVTHAAWPHMQKQGYGRIIFTTSNTGLYGNFGQSNYGAGKAGVIGLMNVLKQEGPKYGIQVNTLAPMAGTAMTEGVMSEAVRNAFRPELASAAMLYLCSEANAESGRILAAAGGYCAAVQMMATQGVFFGHEGNLTPEAIADRWAEITDFSTAHSFPNAGAESEYILSKLFPNEGKL